MMTGLDFPDLVHADFCVGYGSSWVLVSRMLDVLENLRY